LWRPALMISGDQAPSLPHTLDSTGAHRDTRASTGEEIGEGGPLVVYIVRCYWVLAGGGHLRGLWVSAGSMAGVAAAAAARL